MISGGVDLVRFTPHAGSVDTTALLTSARTRSLPVTSGGVVLGTELTPHLRLELALVATVPLIALHYDVMVFGLRESVVNPWPVRPGLALSLSAQ